MPFRSIAQMGYLAHHKDKIGGEKAFEEWKEGTDFSHLPQHRDEEEEKLSRKWLGEDMEKPLQEESEREKRAGTKGSFSRAAKRAGKSTREYAEEKKHASGKIGKRARMALVFMNASH